MSFDSHSDPAWEEYLSTGIDPTVGELGPDFDPETGEPLEEYETEEESNLRDMKKTLIAIIAILIVGAAAVVTCPDNQAHKDAIMAVVNEKINEGFKTDDAELQGLSALFGSLGSGIASKIVENRLVVKNHLLWSTGELQNLDGEYNQISVGVFGHIFTIDKEDLDKAIDKAL